MTPKLFLYFAAAMIFFSSCGSKKGSGGPTDTPTSGTTVISVDETFKPIIESEIAVFESIYPQTGIFVTYGDEVSTLNLLLRDSVRAAVAARPLTAREKESFESRKLFPKEVKIATDGVAIIVNRANKDTLFSMQTLREIFTGKVTRWKELNPASKLGDIQVMFDNPNSSTVRLVIDSVCKGETLTERLRSQLLNTDVVGYVTENPNALGIIGVSWVSNRRDTTCMSFLDHVCVAGLSREAVATRSNSYQPYQAYLATGEYPLRRDVYVLVTEPRTGLASGFASFLTSFRGQRIILKSGILPATQAVRIVQLKEK